MEYPIKEGGLPGFKGDNNIAPMPAAAKKKGTVEKKSVASNSIFPVPGGKKAGKGAKVNKADMKCMANVISPSMC